MIDIKALRDDPERFKNGVRLKRADVNIDELLAIDTRRRELSLIHISEPTRPY